MIGKIKVKLMEEQFGGRYGQLIFWPACFGATMKARFCDVMLTVRRKGEDMVWFAKVVVLRLRNGRGGEEREVTFVQYKKITAPLNAMKKNLSCICVTWSTNNEMDNSVCGKEVEHGCCESQGVVWTLKFKVYDREWASREIKLSCASFSLTAAMGPAMILCESNIP